MHKYRDLACLTVFLLGCVSSRGIWCHNSQCSHSRDLGRDARLNKAEPGETGLRIERKSRASKGLPAVRQPHLPKAPSGVARLPCSRACDW